jgi:hypothetical protein
MIGDMSQAWCYSPLIPATKETGEGGSQDEGQPYIFVCMYEERWKLTLSTDEILNVTVSVNKQCVNTQTNIVSSLEKVTCVKIASNPPETKGEEYRALRRHQSCGYLEFGFIVPQNCENKFLLLKSHNLWHFLTADLGNLCNYIKTSHALINCFRKRMTSISEAPYISFPDVALSLSTWNQYLSIVVTFTLF